MVGLGRASRLSAPYGATKMANQVSSTRFATAQAATAVVDVTTPQRIQVKSIALSVPAGQNAQVSLGATEIASTEGSLSMAMDVNGTPGADLTVTSSGAVSVSVVYQVATRV